MPLSDFVSLTAFEIVFGLSLCTFAYFTFCTTQTLLAGCALSILYACLRGIRRKVTGSIAIKGQGVFITGCDTGFGYELARRLDDLGFTVFAGCLTPGGHGAKQLKHDSSRRLHIVPLDVCKEDSVVEAHNYVLKHLPKTGLWAVVNNAGVYAFGDIEWCTIRQFRTCMDVNFFGAIRVIKAFVHLVRESKGRIVINSSCRGRFPMPGDSAYSATKFALETLSDALRFEMVKFGVKVAIVEPGVYANATGIQSDEQSKRFRTEAAEMWSCASDVTRSVYGRGYLDRAVDGLDKVRAFSALSPDPVTDVLVDAVISERPETRYTIGGTNRWIDIYMNLGRVYGWMPTWLYDWFVVKYTKCDRTLDHSRSRKSE